MTKHEPPWSVFCQKAAGSGTRKAQQSHCINNLTYQRIRTPIQENFSSLFQKNMPLFDYPPSTKSLRLHWTPLDTQITSLLSIVHLQPMICVHPYSARIVGRNPHIVQAVGGLLCKAPDPALLRPIYGSARSTLLHITYTICINRVVNTLLSLQCAISGWFYRVTDCICRRSWRGFSYFFCTV